MRIAMVISTPFPPEEGIGFYAYNLSKKLIERGHILSLITRGNRFKTEKSNFKGINVYKTKYFPLYPFHVDIQRKFLKRFIKNSPEDFDLLHIHSPLSPTVNVGIPIISTIHTSLNEDMKHFQVNNPKTISIKLTTHVSGHRLIQNLINNSDKVTTVSTAVADELKKYYQVKDLLVFGNGVNETVFSPLENKSDDYILYVGRLDYRKGILDLIEALKDVKYNIKIFIAGDGPLKVLIEEKIAKNNMENIFLMGHVTGKRLVKLYQNATLFVFPSHYEGLPTSLLEAMSCALPIITTDIPAHSDLIKKDYNGILVKKNSPLELAEGINQLLEHKTFAKELGKNARETIEENYTWDKITCRYEKLYLDILN